MYLKRVDIVGFKSFTEASVSFGPGVTAVVGPNGTGKSNLVDAILWALGEQSARNLRIDRMEDTIFNGSPSKPPAGMAEVSLTLTDVPSEPQEVIITRRLFRNGQSEYFLNNAPCRLRDVRDLFFTLRAGSKGCTVIEQGKLEILLQSSPQDRRAMIEEAAGTMQYKRQRMETIRKLDASRANLLRLQDLLSELKRQHGTLKRQARAAETYQALNDTIRNLELDLLQHDYQEHLNALNAIATEQRLTTSQETELLARLNQLTLDLQVSEDALASESMRLAQARDTVTQSRIGLERARTSLEGQRSHLVLYEDQAKHVTTSINHLHDAKRSDDTRMANCLEKLDHVTRQLAEADNAFLTQERALMEAQARHHAAQTDIDRLRATQMNLVQAEAGESNTLSALHARHHELGLRHDQDRAELEALHVEIASTARRHEELSRQHQDLQKRLEQIRSDKEDEGATIERLTQSMNDLNTSRGRLATEMATLQTRLTALQSILDEQWSSYGQQGKRITGPGIRSTIPNLIEVPHQYERAIEVVLGERLRGILIDGHQYLKEALNSLRDQGLSMGVFIPLQPRVANGQPRFPSEDPGILALARNVVTAAPEFGLVLDYLLAGVVIVEDLDRALGLWEEYGQHAANGFQSAGWHAPLFVTLQGEYIDVGGAIVVGSVPSTTGLLQRKREISDLEDTVAQLGLHMTAVQEEQQTLTTNLDARTKRHHEHQMHERDVEIQLAGLAQESGGTLHALHRLQERREAVHNSLTGAAGALAKISDDLSTIQARKESLTEDRADIDARLVQAQQHLDQMSHEVQQCLQQVTDTRLLRTSLLERFEHLQSERAALEQADSERTNQLAGLSQEHARLTTQYRTAQEELGIIESSLTSLQTAATSNEAALATCQAQQDQLTALIRTKETARTNSHKGLDDIRRRLSDLAVKRAEHSTTLEHFDGVLRGTYQTSFEKLPTHTPDTPIDHEGARALLEQHRHRRDRLGPINLAAMDESKEVEERLTFFTIQEQDLIESIASLEEIMRRLQETTRQMFHTTFEAIRKTFHELFVCLFEGGNADLVLDNPDPASAGVEIIAQPPGKRLKHLSTLSGGEKALTAIALILASYLQQPTPFCVLDEIDAPLDDENVGRFLRVLREVAKPSQVMIITHNKLTMAAADTLYGTTMAEPGVTMLLSASLETAPS